MTAAELLERGRAAARSPWALPVLVGVLVLALAWRLNAGRQAEAEARRLAEETQLRAQGLLVVEQAKSRALELEARRLVAQNEDLGVELERARRASPGATVTGTVSASTGPRPAGGAPRAGQACPAPEAPPAPEPPPVCLLAAGDQAEVRVDQVELETRDGARVVAGAAAAWRLEPGPPARLFGGGFQARLSKAQGEVELQPPGWGAGVWLGVGREGWAAGPAAAFPPLHLGPLQLELVAGVGLGTGGMWQGGASGIVRW